MTDIGLSRLLAVALREWMPLFKAQRISPGLDDRTDGWRVAGPPGGLEGPMSEVRALSCSLHRLIGACAELMGPGGLIGFEAQAVAQPEGGCRLHWGITGQPERRGQRSFEQALQRLDLAPLRPGPGPGPGAACAVAHGLCPASRAALALAWQPGGFELRASYRLQRAWQRPTAPPPPWGSRHLWLVQPDGVMAGAVARDALRHGWTVVTLTDGQQVLRRLAQSPQREPLPDLLLVFVEADTPALLLQQVRRTLPQRTLAVAAVETGSLWLGHPDTLPGYQMGCHPLSAADWQAWDRLLRQPPPRPPQGSDGPPRLAVRVLVAQHDDVPRCLTQSLLQAMGYEVLAARDAVQALDICLRLAPAVMLLDPALPGAQGDGLVQRLRKLQRTGLAMPCRIVLHAAVQDGAAACLALGDEVDGFVPQPVSLLALRSEIRRWTLAYLQ